MCNFSGLHAINQLGFYGEIWHVLLFTCVPLKETLIGIAKTLFTPDFEEMFWFALTCHTFCMGGILWTVAPRLQ